MQAMMVTAKQAATSQPSKLSIRDKVILEHLPLVKAIAARVRENLPVHVDLDDLVHAGREGTLQKMAAAIPMNRFGEPGEIVEVRFRLSLLIGLDQKRADERSPIRNRQASQQPFAQRKLPAKQFTNRTHPSNRSKSGRCEILKKCEAHAVALNDGCHKTNKPWKGADL